MSHTPGKWSVGERNPADNTLQVVATMEGHKHTRFIADVQPCPFYNDQQQANAELIAQAPDLLAEVTRLREINAELVKSCEIAYVLFGDFKNQWAGRGSDYGQIMLVRLREALAAATDRPPRDVQDDYCNRTRTSASPIEDILAKARA